MCQRVKLKYEITGKETIISFTAMDVIRKNKPEPSSMGIWERKQTLGKLQYSCAGYPHNIQILKAKTNFKYSFDLGQPHQPS